MSYRILASADTPRLEWLALRKQGIGASESAAILGDTNWGTPLTIWQQKRDPEVVDVGTDRMLWGQRMEPVIIEAVREDHEELGEILPSLGLLQCVEHPHLLGTLDARIDSPHYGAIVPLEIKNVSAYEKKNWFNRDGLIAVPPKYAVQVRQQAFIEDDAPGGYVAVLFDGNDLEVIWVSRSQEFIDRHLTTDGTLGRYWHENVIGGVMPDPILGDDLASIWPTDPKETVDADDIFAEMRERWIDAKGREKTVKEDIEALRFYFEAYMETAGVAVDPETQKSLLELRVRRGQQRVRVETHAEHHPDCDQCVTRDRDSRTPTAIIPKRQEQVAA